MDAILISGMEGPRKPDPALFLKAAATIGTTPTQCLFIGDDPVVDVLGAAAVSMKTAWLRDGTDWPSDGAAIPRAGIDYLSELLGQIEAVEENKGKLTLA